MTSKTTCFCCESKSQSTDTIQEQSSCVCYEEVQNIWAKKMHESKLFLITEIPSIVTVWTKFIRKRIAICRTSDAEQFYIEAAVDAANNVKHFSEDGWSCFEKEYPMSVLQCSEESLVPKDANSSSSVESTQEYLSQIEFLLRLVASSNFGLSLVKIALDSSFEPTYMRMRSTQLYNEPNLYLKLEGEEFNKDNMKANLLNGEYDDYILPLQLANEVTDEFWNNLDDELIAKMEE